MLPSSYLARPDGTVLYAETVKSWLRSTITLEDFGMFAFKTLLLLTAIFIVCEVLHVLSELYHGHMTERDVEDWFVGRLTIAVALSVVNGIAFSTYWLSLSALAVLMLIGVKLALLHGIPTLVDLWIGTTKIQNPRFFSVLSNEEAAPSYRHLVGQTSKPILQYLGIGFVVNLIGRMFISDFNTMLLNNIGKLILVAAIIITGCLCYQNRSTAN